MSISIDQLQALQALPSVNLFDDGVSIEAPTKFDKGSIGPRKTYLENGLWKLDFPNGDQLKVSHGVVQEMVQTYGTKRSIRRFTWLNESDPEQIRLSTIEVIKGEYRYHHSRRADGSWEKRTWDKENQRWSEPELEERSFDFDNETYGYKYVNASDGIVHIIYPDAIEKAITPEGVISEYVSCRLARITKGELVRKLKWRDNVIESLVDGVQQKVWHQTAENVWTSNHGDKQYGELIFKLDGTFGFRREDETTFIDMNGYEYASANH